MNYFELHKPHAPISMKKDMFISFMYYIVSHPGGLCWDLIPCCKMLARAEAHEGSEFPVLDDMDILHTHTKYSSNQTSAH